MALYDNPTELWQVRANETGIDPTKGPNSVSGYDGYSLSGTQPQAPVAQSPLQQVAQQSQMSGAQTYNGAGLNGLTQGADGNWANAAAQVPTSSSYAQSIQQGNPVMAAELSKINPDWMNLNAEQLGPLTEQATNSIQRAYDVNMNQGLVNSVDARRSGFYDPSTYVAPKAGLHDDEQAKNQTLTAAQRMDQVMPGWRDSPDSAALQKAYEQVLGDTTGQGQTTAPISSIDEYMKEFGGGYKSFDDWKNTWSDWSKQNYNYSNNATHFQNLYNNDPSQQRWERYTKDTKALSSSAPILAQYLKDAASGTAQGYSSDQMLNLLSPLVAAMQPKYGTPEYESMKGLSTEARRDAALQPLLGALGVENAKDFAFTDPNTFMQNYSNSIDPTLKKLASYLSDTTNASKVNLGALGKIYQQYGSSLPASLAMQQQAVSAATAKGEQARALAAQQQAAANEATYQQMLGASNKATAFANENMAGNAGYIKAPTSALSQMAESFWQ